MLCSIPNITYLMSAMLTIPSHGRSIAEVSHIKPLSLVPPSDCGDFSSPKERFTALPARMLSPGAMMGGPSKPPLVSGAAEETYGAFHKNGTPTAWWFSWKIQKNWWFRGTPHDLGHLQSGDLRVKQCHVYHPLENGNGWHHESDCWVPLLITR